MTTHAHAILELTVNNHPGVMMHVSSMFARRAFNVEGILCLPRADSSRSRIWLRVKEDERLEQVVRQLAKLEDVLNIQRHGATHEVFDRVEPFFSADTVTA